MKPSLSIRPLDADSWPAFAALVERHNGVWGGCWCLAFHPKSADTAKSPEGNRAVKRRLVDEGAAHAALVFDGDRAVGWCQFGTPAELPRIYHRKQYEASVVDRPTTGSRAFSPTEMHTEGCEGPWGSIAPARRARVWNNDIVS